MSTYTTYADRQQIALLREQGLTYWAIVAQTGWAYETVRKICRAYQREGEKGLHPGAVGRPARGSLSTFSPLVRFAALKIKRQHPRWGPDVVQAELRKRPWAVGVRLPGASSLGLYFQQFGARLVQPRRHKQLSGAHPAQPAWPVVHGCWQIDVDEKIPLPGYGRAHILNLVDHTSGLKIGARLFPAVRQGKGCRISWPQYRQALRQAFTEWGRPDRLRTDRERVLVAKGDYPFPMDFTLWLTGLGIEHELIRRVTQNGCVERSHQTWEARLDGYGPFDLLADWQQVVDYERWRMNAVLPSRGRHCGRRPPLLVYPQARQPRRPYRQAEELTMFQMARVEAYLAQGRWLRRTNGQGQFWLNGQCFNLRTTYKLRWAEITYAPGVGFLAACPPQAEVRLLFQVDGLTPEAITGLG